jgi:sterol 3beta-glucosyltransferase
MKIALVTLGTRGDVQPYIAVARALMARGHQVTLAASEEHAELVRAYGVSYKAMRGNFREILQTDLGRAWLTSGDSPREYARYGKELFVPMQRAACEDADAAVEGADCAAFYTMALGAMHAAERRKIPVVALAPWPMIATREFAPMGAEWLPNIGFLNKLAGKIIPRIAFSAFNEEHQKYREHVGLPRYAAKDTLTAITASGIPTAHLFSEAVIPRPADWDARHAVAGYAFTPPLDYEPPRALVDFLASGPPPIYLGFGSMTGFEPEQLAELATSAARMAGVRAVIATGWAGLDVKAAHDVYAIDEVPHDWLFPRVSAVVHHGGAGTFAEGLRAGKPTVIAAFFADQPFWGRINERLGTGPRALLRKKINAENLAQAIRAALDGPYREKAEAVAAQLAKENGADRAAALIEAAIAGS